MRIYTTYFVIVLTAFLVASNCGGAYNSQARIDEEFSLSVGQRAFIVQENLAIKFKEVLEDSRCPRDVTCIWAGRVTCAIELTKAGVVNELLLSQSGLTNGYSSESYDGYELSFRVTPYPKSGEKIAQDKYRLHLIITLLSDITKIIGSIIAKPPAFEGKEVTIVGYYRGWDLLHEANTGPPVTRSDWVIKDATGAIYVSANSEADVPQGLRPNALSDTNIRIRVKGVIRVTELGQPYVEATSIRQIP